MKTWSWANHLALGLSQYQAGSKFSQHYIMTRQSGGQCHVLCRLSPENELLTEAQCKGIAKASILHNVDDLAPAETALPLHKLAQLLKSWVIWLAMRVGAPTGQALPQQLSL